MAHSKDAQDQPAMNQEVQLFTSADGQAQLHAALEHETVWLSLQQLAELFGRDKSVISRHLKNIFDSHELQRDAVVAKNATTAADGTTYQVEYFNLDAIISVGYRVSAVLKQHLDDGYSRNCRNSRQQRSCGPWVFPQPARDRLTDRPGRATASLSITV